VAVLGIGDVLVEDPMTGAAGRLRNESSRPLGSFLVLACVLSWPIWLLSGVLPRGGAGPYDFRWLIAQGSLLVALLLHTSINVMGDVGLSSFEATSVVFFFMVAVAAVVMLVSSPVFRQESRPSDRPSTGPSRLST
jgi:hypothetical protein